MRTDQTSRAVLERLERLPRLTVPTVALVVMLIGLMARPLYAVPALTLLLALVVWLASLSWPHADTRGRLLRTAVVGAVAAVLLARLAQVGG